MPAFEHRVRVRFQHADPAGIVFFANLLVYCHEAYEEFLRSGGMPLDQLLQRREQSLPIGQAEITFKRPCRFGQMVTVRVRVGRIGDRSFRLEYDLLGEDKEHLASAATVHVCVDPATMSSTPLPGPLRSFLESSAAPA